VNRDGDTRDGDIADRSPEAIGRTREPVAPARAAAAARTSALPLAFIVDYDGTICHSQVTDVLMRAFAPTDEWRALDERYLRGELGSREELAQFVAWLPPDREPVMRVAAAQPHDRTFVDFVRLARANGIGIEIVSDGYGFYVAPALEALGVADLAIATARTTWETGRPEITFPYGHQACFVCGTCKRDRVLREQEAGRHVVVVGDGTSDRFAAAHADTVFAKAPLTDWCEREGWPYEPWADFDDVSAWLRRILADPTLLVPSKPRTFICGPEVWGPGRTSPPDPQEGPGRHVTGS
jgi:2,3-diketo-5-methylthio-1-phosphopentane phosphatase